MKLNNFSTIVDILDYRSEHNSNKTAYKFRVNDREENFLTYGELVHRSRAIAARMQAFAKPGDRVLILHPPGLEYICSFFACLIAGFLAVPVYPPNTRNIHRLRTIATDCKPTLIIGVGKFEKDYIDLSENIVTEEESITTGNSNNTIFYINTSNIPDTEAALFQPRMVQPSNLSFIQYTSGSTSDPKGVVLNHDNIYQNSLLIQKAFRHTDDLCVVGWLPPYHDMGLIGCLIQPVFVGGVSVLMSPASFIKRPLRWLKAISDHRDYETVSSGGPNFSYDYCTNLISDAEAAELNLENWQYAFSGAEPVRASTLERFAAKFRVSGFKNSSFFPVYGLAETTLLASAGEGKDEPIVLSFDRTELEKNNAVQTQGHNKSARLVACGSKLENHDIKIVDPDRLTILPDGQVGEIWLTGPSVAMGYWNKEEESKSLFQAKINGLSGNPDEDATYLRTGDMGFLYQGQLFISSRTKDLIVIDGKNHYPHDIEQTLEQADSLFCGGNNAAFSIDNDDTEQLVVIQEIKRKHVKELDTQQLFQKILSSISLNHELRPGAIVLVESPSIPKTSSGKIQRQLCKNMFLNNQLKIVSQWQQQRP